MNADSIKIESDEDGFHLIVVTDAAHHDFNIQDVAEELYDAVKREIGPWLWERDEALAGTGGKPVSDAILATSTRVFECDPDESAGLRDLAVATAYDTAYEINDPSHPEFHSVHADLWDAREGK